MAVAYIMTHCCTACQPIKIIGKLSTVQLVYTTTMHTSRSQINTLNVSSENSVLSISEINLVELDLPLG